MIITAQDLLDELLAIKETHGHLQVPINVYSCDQYGRYPISLVDEFTDGEDEHLHSIDLNF